MRGKLLLVMIAIFLTARLSPAKFVAQEVGDEKEPELRAEPVRRVKEDQDIRGEFDRFRKEHGLFGTDDKTLNEKLHSDEALEKAFLDIVRRMQKHDEDNTLRVKEIVAKYGSPGRTLVGTDGATAAWLIVQHSDRDVAFQRKH